MADDNKEILVKFGAMLRKIRTDKGLTLLDMEVNTGINEGDISRIENGKKNFNFTTLIKLAKGLDIPVSKLLGNL